MATNSYRGEIEALIPSLRQCARALAGGSRADHTDDMVHEALSHTLKAERLWMGEDVASKLFGRLIGANRTRLRSELAERRSLPGGQNQGASSAGRASIQFESHGGDASATDHALDTLALNEREALVLLVLGRLDYTQAAQALAIPVGTLVTRVTHARARLGEALWDQPRRLTAPSPGHVGRAPHLRLVKS